MIVLQTIVDVKGIHGKAITDFLLDCTDEAYQRWWEGTHLQFHVVRDCPGHVGDLVYMDEFIGKYRLKMKAVVISVKPGERVVWQMKKFVRLPVFLFLELTDSGDGVRVSHTIRAGFDGVGGVLDFAFRLYLSEEFERAMDEHVRTEFLKLRDLLQVGTN